MWMPSKWTRSNVHVSPITSVVQLHLSSCTHQGSERGLVQRRVTFHRHVYLCRTQPMVEASVGAFWCDLPSAWTPASLEPVCCLLRLNTLCSKLLRSEPECLSGLTHTEIRSSWRQNVSTLRLSLRRCWQQSTDPHFLPGERWQLFSKENSHWKV